MRRLPHVPPALRWRYIQNAPRRQPTATTDDHRERLTFSSAEEINRFIALLSAETPRQKQFMEAWMKLVIHYVLITQSLKAMDQYQHYQAKLTDYFKNLFQNCLDEYLRESNFKLTESSRAIVADEFFQEFMPTVGQVAGEVFTQMMMRELTFRRASSGWYLIFYRDPWRERGNITREILTQCLPKNIKKSLLETIIDTTYQDIRKRRDVYINDFSSAISYLVTACGQWRLYNIPILIFYLNPITAGIVGNLSVTFLSVGKNSAFFIYLAYVLNKVPIEDEKHYFMTRALIAGVLILGLISCAYELFFPVILDLVPSYMKDNYLDSFYLTVFSFLVPMFIFMTAFALLSDFKFKISAFSPGRLPQKIYADLSSSWGMAISSLRNGLLESLPKPRPVKPPRAAAAAEAAPQPTPRLSLPIAAALPPITDEKTNVEPKAPKRKTRKSQPLLSLFMVCLSPAASVFSWDIETKESARTVTFSEDTLFLTKTPSQKELIVKLWTWAQSRMHYNNRHFLLLDFHVLQYVCREHYEAFLRETTEGHIVADDEQPGCRVLPDGVYVKTQSTQHSGFRLFFQKICTNAQSKILYGNPTLTHK